MAALGPLTLQILAVLVTVQRLRLLLLQQRDLLSLLGLNLIRQRISSSSPKLSSVLAETPQ